MSQARRRPWAAWWVTLLALATVVGSWGGGLAAQTAGSAADAFDQHYAATDGSGGGGLPALWGDRLLERSEPYQEAPDQRRAVRYYAKGRMELNQPALGTAGITAGLLVPELIQGTLRTGDNAMLAYAGADIPVAGDRDRAANPLTPTYRSFRLLLTRTPSAVGQPVDTVLGAPEGPGFLSLVITSRRDPALGQLATNATYIDSAGHNIPDVFWTVLRAQGAAGGHQLTWTSLYGWPLTEAYWVRAQQGGRPVDIMVQLFERRTLLYIPSAPSGQRVQIGDVGRDYLLWRDGQANAHNELTRPVSRNGVVVPPIAEAGTLFTIVGAGFKPGEQIIAWAEIGGSVQAIGISSRYRVADGGLVGLRLRTVPFLSGAGSARVVIVGVESGNESVLQFRWLASDLLTPGAEAVEPTTVPAGRGAQITPAVLTVGRFGVLRAEGFAPGETVTAWVTTGLNRVIPYANYLDAIRRSPSLPGIPTPTPTPSAPLRLRPIADADGRLTLDLPGPGFAVPGIYAVTLVGDVSGNRAVAYFRARAGEVGMTNLLYGVSLGDLLGRRLDSLNTGPVTDPGAIETETPLVELVEDETVDLNAVLSEVVTAGHDLASPGGDE